ncbi:MAG: type I restriction enzyme HsdR N-terminal domain-containing protein [Anaerolineae bacterium]|nr:type I restriction enzyme HsdR N-terminal domain-containing protein [Anaerolineae bacterium]
MDFSDRIQELAARIPKQRDLISTEEATKNAFVMPFISALGYDVFDPSEVTPELVADVGVKKGEKVDYAILKEGQPIMLFECKWHGHDLGKAHASQLFRYFSVTHARFAVLTNGVIYRFYTDLETPNKMDAKHFFEFNLEDYSERELAELKKFTKFSYDLDNILTTASELKYTRAIKQIIADQWLEPSDEFIRFFVSQVHNGRFTKAVRDEFESIVKKALQQFLNERINQRLVSALTEEKTIQTPTQDIDPSGAINGDEPRPSPEEAAKVVTTDEEKEAYFIVKSILRRVVDAHRVVMRDVQSYCGILLDDNNRKPLCRLHFNSSQKYLGLIDVDKNEEKVPIEGLDEIYQYTDRLRETVGFYE